MTDNLRWREFENLQFYVYTLHNSSNILSSKLIKIINLINGSFVNYNFIGNFDIHI